MKEAFIDLDQCQQSGKLAVFIGDRETSFRLLGDGCHFHNLKSQQLTQRDADEIRKYLDAAFPVDPVNQVLDAPGISTATDEAAQMLKAGWTIEHHRSIDRIFWRRPDGFSGSGYMSTSLYPPKEAVDMAIELGHVQPVMRAPA